MHGLAGKRSGLCSAIGRPGQHIAGLACTSKTNRDGNNGRNVVGPRRKMRSERLSFIHSFSAPPPRARRTRGSGRKAPACCTKIRATGHQSGATRNALLLGARRLRGVCGAAVAHMCSEADRARGPGGSGGEKRRGHGPCLLACLLPAAVQGRPKALHWGRELPGWRLALAQGRCQKEGATRRGSGAGGTGLLPRAG